MLLIVAALKEEIGIASDLCTEIHPLRIGGVRAWSARQGGRKLWLLKTGVGPERAERSIGRFLADQKPEAILVIGYAGGLAPDLQIGSLFLPSRVSLLESSNALLKSASWELPGNADLIGRGSPPGLVIHGGELLTSRHIIGNPGLKRLLHHNFHAAAVDMETALFARAAQSSGVSSVYCARAISDDAGDDFLAPFSFVPNAGFASVAARVVRSGNWIRRYREWREQSALARRTLKKFLLWFLTKDVLQGS